MIPGAGAGLLNVYELGIPPPPPPPSIRRKCPREQWQVRVPEEVVCSQSQQEPVVSEPLPVGHSTPSRKPPSTFPSGLEYLSRFDQLVIRQKVELCEVICGCETKNLYKIKDVEGRSLYSAKEDTEFCLRQWCGGLRPFEMEIKDVFDREVIHLSRPFACGCFLIPCCLQSLEVFAPPRRLAGTVEQTWSCLCLPSFVVKDNEGKTVFKIEGPWCTFSLGGSVVYEIISLDGEVVGEISKKWSGCCREMFTDADHFVLTFPLNLDVELKAVLIGAVFLIDFMFYEHKQQGAFASFVNMVPK